MNRIEELACREIDPGLDRAENRELRRLLRADPEARRLYRDILDVERALRDLAPPIDVAARVIRQILPAPAARSCPPSPVAESALDRWIPRAAIAAGFAAAAVIASVLLREDSPVADTWAVTESSLEIEGRDPASSSPEPLRPHDRLRNPSPHPASFHYRDQTRIALEPHSEIVFQPGLPQRFQPSKGLALISGELLAEVTPQPRGQPFVLTTPHAVAVVRGTRFSLRSDPSQTRLEVTSGHVDFQDPQGLESVAVTPGMFAVATATGPIELRPLRVRENLLTLYTFATMTGNQVSDRSGTGSPLHLQFLNPGRNAGPLPGGGFTTGPGGFLESIAPAVALTRACQNSGALTLEVWCEPARATQEGPARILTLSRGSRTANFSLGHDGSAFVARLRTSKSSDASLFELKSAPGSASTQLTHLVFTSDGNGRQRFYLNGIQAAEGNAGGDFSTWTSGLLLALGADPETSNRRPWDGRIHLAAIYDRSLSPGEIARNLAAGPRHP